MNRPYFAPAMVLLATVALSSPAVGAAASRLPEAAPVPQQATPVAPAPIEVAPVERASRTAPFPVGWEDDVYCAGWIGSPDEPVTGRIVAESRTLKP